MCEEMNPGLTPWSLVLHGPDAGMKPPPHNSNLFTQNLRFKNVFSFEVFWFKTNTGRVKSNNFNGPWNKLFEQCRLVS